MSGNLSAEIRALLGQIGLQEGEAEQSVLSRYKGKEQTVKDDDDDGIDIAAIRDEGEDEENDAENLTPAQKRAQAKAAKRELVQAQNAAGQAKAAAAKAKLQPVEPVAPAKGKGKQSAGATAAGAATPAASGVVSLSRPKVVKEEPAARVKKVKSEEADAEDGADAEDVPRPVQAKDAFPLNNPSLPSAAPPKTIPGGVGAANLKWWDQAPHVTLTFPPAAKSALSTGKKVALSSTGASSAGFVLPKSVEECYTLAQERLESTVAHFEAVNAGRSSDARWLSTVMTSGTLSDKVAGMTLMVQEAPLYRVAIVDKLLAMAHKQGRRENGMAIDALKDLFLNDLLPPRKLYAFAQQPFFKARAAAAAAGGAQGGKKAGAAATPALAPPSETQLAYWMLEDQLKSRYMDFLSILEEGTHDEMAYVKKARVAQIYDLLLGSPERERVLLALLVNKLGDGDKKIGSRVVFLLNELVKKHPGFKLVLIGELEQLLYRENISKRAQYYSIIFLNQLVFIKGEDETLANKLIAVYFLLFKQFITANKKEREAELEIEAKRAAKKKARAKAQSEAGHKPYKAKSDHAPPKKYGGSNSVSSKFANLGNKKGFVSVEASDALRSKLLGGLLTGINRALPYASPMAVEGVAPPSGSTPAPAGQSGEEIVLAQMDMIFNLVHTTAFNTAIQALMLLYQVLSRSIAQGGGPNTDRFYRALYDKVLAPELLQSSSKHGLFLNLLYKSLKNDSNSERVAAFAKRMLQVALQHAPPFICGVLFLLSEVLKTQKGLAMLITQPQTKFKVVEAGAKGATAVVDDDEEEHFRDVLEDEEEEKKLKEKEAASKAAAAAAASGQSGSALLSAEMSSMATVREAYDPSKRDPQYAHARSSCLWELIPFASHYHPSVVHFARDILSSVSIVYGGDPLRDFGAMQFLDRFCFKNPKKVAKGAGVHAVKDEKTQNAFTRPKSALVYTPANTPAFLARAQAAGGAVADDQQFLLKYFQTKSASDATKRRKAAEELGVDATEEEEDAFADELIEREMRKVEPDGWDQDEEDDFSGDDDEDDDEDDEDAEGAEFDEEGDADLDFEGDDAPMDEVDEEAAAEALALAEMEGGGGDGDEEEVEMSDDDDDDDDGFGFSESDSDEDVGSGSSNRGSKDRNASVFASAEEFADLLNAANDTGVSAKQSAWEKRSTIENERDRPKRGKGSKGAGGAEGYKSAPKVAASKGKAGQRGGKGGATPEKPSFKRKLAEVRAKQGSNKKGGNKKQKRK